MANKPAASQNSRPFGVTVGILFGCIAVVFFMIYMQDAPARKKAENISEQLNPYLDQYASSATGTELVSEKPYIEGKAVMVRFRKGESELDLFYNDEIQATTPDEVNTVVLVDCDDRREVGKYENGGIAYRIICKVTVVNLLKKIRFPTEELEGGDPPESINSEYKAGVGSEPSYEAYYVTQLPRK